MSKSPIITNDINITLSDEQLEYIGYNNLPMIERTIKALINNFLNNNTPTPIPYWMDQWENDEAFTKFVYVMCKLDYLTSAMNPQRRWGEMNLIESKLIQLVGGEATLNSIKIEYKVNKYTMTSSSKATDRTVATAIGYKETGLVREGFAKVASHKFQFSTYIIRKYFKPILKNAIKAMEKLNLEQKYFDNPANYTYTVERVLKQYLTNPDAEYTLGENISDSRGRAIFQALREVFNPISNKDARSLIVAPARTMTLADIDAIDAIFLSVAELLGNKRASWTRKRMSGKGSFYRKQYLKLDLNTEEGRKDLHQNIWLERIYTQLTVLYTTGTVEWSVPVELDATASLAQVSGALLDDQQLLDATNVINPDNLKDIWTVDKLTRNQVKLAATPMVYGSAQNAAKLWKKADLDFNAEQLRAFTALLKANTGLASIIALKEFIIGNVVPQPEMKVKIRDEEFTIYCNRYKYVGEYMKAYTTYDSNTNSVVTIHNTHTKRIPDLEQFRRYFVTLLIHNLDGQIANHIGLNLDWCITIHDAFIVHPLDAVKTRTLYTRELKAIHDGRDRILADYFNSIGIVSSPATRVQWMKVKQGTQPVTATTFSHSALK